MVKVISVKFKTSGRVYYFDPLNFEVHEGEGVIVETARGIEYGTVAKAPHEVEESEIIAPLKAITRVATPVDTRMRDENAAKEGEALVICQDRIEQHGLTMKLISADYSFNGNKLVFYFTADGRVDFRELVKDLAFVFKTRIELRQIGVRDEAKLLGGLGSCGRPVCCKSFMDDFHPVSIKMAKEQNLSLSPTKISGLCGRLMCCLQYEQEAYETMRKKMPRVGKPILTADGEGVVMENNVITEKTRVRLQAEDGTVDVRDYPYEQLAAPGQPLPACARKLAEEKSGESPEPIQRHTPRQDRPRNNGRGGQRNGSASVDRRERSPQSAAPTSPLREGGKSAAKPAQPAPAANPTDPKPAQTTQPKRSNRRRSYGPRRK
ncbi:MAG: stage 0 sporulation family protein [Clostridiales bacterium]|nr:stage 0 sporulation family protein [Clostridiales bacterium]